jgi:serine/threonine kinase PknH
VVMTTFICHSSRDGAAVRSLVQHLTAARESVWLDQSLSGGEAWWTAILERIRSCSVFVVALSNNTLQSKPCRAEMGYAKALGLPILPVQVGDVDSYRLDPIFTVQLVDYRNPDVATGMALIAALRERAAERQGLPEPLPAPPPIPYAYLQRLGAAIDSPDEMSPADQTTMLVELRRALRDEDDDSVRDDIRRLLRALRRRSEVTHLTVAEIDELLHIGGAASAPSSAGRGGGGAEPTQPGSGPAPTAFDVPASLGSPPTEVNPGGTEEPLPHPVSADHFDQPRARPGADESVSAKPRWWRRRTPLGIAAAAVVVVAVTATVGYLLPGRNSQPSPTSQPLTPIALTALEGLLLSPDQINTAMGATGVTVAATYTAMYDDSAGLADKACQPLDSSAQAAVYAGSGWSAVRAQTLHEPGDNYAHSVGQSLVLFSSAHDAGAFFTASAQSWSACSNRRFTYTQAGQPDSVWTVGPVSNTNGTLSATKTQEGSSGYTCRRALTVANNVAIDVQACSSNQSDSAVNIAHQIAAKVPTN